MANLFKCGSGGAIDISEVKVTGGFQTAGGGWSLCHMYLTINIKGKSKCTIASSTGAVITLDGVVTAYTAGVPFNISGKTTMVIKQERSQQTQIVWNSSATGILIE